MPVNSIQAYFEKARRIIAECGLISSHSLLLEERSYRLGYIRGEIKLIDDSVLFFREFIDLSKERFKDDYSYQYQIENGSLVFRYDNASHHPKIKSFPHHKHHRSEENIIECPEPDLESVLLEIEIIIGHGGERTES